MQTPEVAIFIRAALLTSLFILTACGQKGPLYLPQDPDAIPEDVISRPVVTEAAIEKDNTAASAPSNSQD